MIIYCTSELNGGYRRGQKQDCVGLGLAIARRRRQNQKAVFIQTLSVQLGQHCEMLTTYNKTYDKRQIFMVFLDTDQNIAGRYHHSNDSQIRQDKHR